MSPDASLPSLGEIHDSIGVYVRDNLVVRLPDEDIERLIDVLTGIMTILRALCPPPRPHHGVPTFVPDYPHGHGHGPPHGQGS